MATFPIAVDDDGSPRAALTIAADAVRAFNHRTATRFDPDNDGWWYPGDAYAALGNLNEMTGSMSQAIQHIAGALAQQAADGHIGVDGQPDPADAVETASVALEHARQALSRFASAISEAHQATAPMHYAGPQR